MATNVATAMMNLLGLHFSFLFVPADPLGSLSAAKATKRWL